MGIVYKALDTRLQRVVALKFLTKTDATTTDASKRFAHEALAAAALNHPNIATIYEYDEAPHPFSQERVAFIAMEYVEGMSLRQKLAGGALPIDDVLSLTLQLSRGLEAAHQQGVVHRDIKPGNIIITPTGTLKILDFGVAKSSRETSMTDAAHIVGSVAYMSPEQITGDTIDERTDIWSLGVVVFEMLAGRHPFRGEAPAAIMYSIAHEPPADLPELRPETPPVLLEACRLCLEKPKVLRPQSMSDIRAMLEGQSPRIATPSARWRISARRRRIGILCGAAALTGLLLWLLIPRGGEGSPHGWRLAVLPFENQTGETSVAGWGSAIQSLFVRELTGVEGVAVIDPSTINGYLESSFGTSQPKRGTQLLSVLKATGLTVLVDGNVTRIADRYNIQTRVVEPTTGELLMSTTQEVTAEHELTSAITAASQAVLDLYQVRVLHSAHEKDLRPWISYRKQDIAAIKEFVQASDILYKGDRGSDVHLRRALELDTMFLTARVWLVSSLVGNGQFDEARTQLQFLERHQHEASPFEQAMVRWASAYAGGDTIAQARELERALDFSPGNNILLFNLAIVRLRMGEYDAAIRAIKPAIDLKWKFSPAYFVLAACYTTTRRYAEAKDVLEASLAITPVFRDTYGLLSLVWHRLGDSVKSGENASMFMRRSREVGDSLVQSYADLGDIFRDDSAHAKAASYYRRGLAVDPANASLRVRMGSVLLALDRRDSARSECLRALALDTGSTEAHWVLGQLAERDQDTAGALGHYHRYLQLSRSGMHARAVDDRLRLLSKP